KTSSAETTKTAGSVGVTRNSRLPSTRARPKAPARPQPTPTAATIIPWCATPDTGDSQTYPLRGHDPPDRGRRPAERDADADLARAQRDDVGHDTVEADRGEQKRDCRRGADERQDEPAARRRLRDYLRNPARAVQRQRR